MGDVWRAKYDVRILIRSEVRYKNDDVRIVSYKVSIVKCELRWPRGYSRGDRNDFETWVIINSSSTASGGAKMISPQLPTYRRSQLTIFKRLYLRYPKCRTGKLYKGKSCRIWSCMSWRSFDALQKCSQLLWERANRAYIYAENTGMNFLWIQRMKRFDWEMTINFHRHLPCYPANEQGGLCSP